MKYQALPRPSGEMSSSSFPIAASDASLTVPPSLNVARIERSEIRVPLRLGQPRISLALNPGYWWLRQAGRNDRISSVAWITADVRKRLRPRDTSRAERSGSVPPLEVCSQLGRWPSSICTISGATCANAADTPDKTAGDASDAIADGDSPDAKPGQGSRSWSMRR
jgi:hypothetical protein